MKTTASAREAQQAFTGLLAKPLVTAAGDPRLYRLVLRHQQAVTDAARRLGYRVQRVGQAVRLIRVPLGGAVTRPPRPADAPERRMLALVCCLAACCEDVAGRVTLQRLSDMVRDLPAARYDPDDQTQRRLLRDAAAYLASWGVLRPRSSDERLLDEWTESGTGPGAGYEVDRDALLLMTSPDVVDLALNPGVVTASETVRQLRALLETPFVAYEDLPPAEAEALRAHRGQRAADVAQITGGAIEARTEGLLVVLADDEVKPPTVADWPRARATDWVALLMADQAGRDGTRHADGTVHLSTDEVDAVVDDLISWRGDYMTVPQKTVPGTVRRDAERLLTELGLLRVSWDGSWTLLAAAGRYRDPDVTITDNTEPAR
ncbi:TIGR02678 family protein [Actinoplanes sp. NPDC048796]|uniref:TIGR02678 family protein n=1 Tax=unclassified Actinoplanes TaxID=2626549 RepID=UPI0033E42257